MISVTATILAAVLQERNRALEGLRQSQDELENRVVERTQELSSCNIQLKQEVAERRQTEERLRESEERYRNFFVTSRDGVFMTNVDGKLFDVNTAALEMLGYGPEEREAALHKSVADLYANPEERTSHVALVSRLGVLQRIPG